MATAKQTRAALKNVTKAHPAATSSKTIAHMSEQTRTALGQQEAAGAERKRTGDAPKNPGRALRARQAARSGGAFQDGAGRTRPRARRGLGR